MKNSITTSKFPLPKDNFWTRLPDRVLELKNTLNNLIEKDAGTTNKIPKFTNSNTLGDSNISESSGRILINTTTDNGVDELQVDGSILGTSIKKVGGLSTQYLMADGSVTTGTGGGGGDVGAVVIKYIATNYTNLTTTVAPTAAEGELAFVYASQGTVDLDRKIKGIYIWQSGEWVYANQELQTNTDTNRNTLNNFISGISSTVRSTVLTGLSLASSTAITASDTILSAFGKLQKQITDGFLWHPNQVSLSDFQASGAVIYFNVNVGENRAFRPDVNDFITASIPLANNKKDYDGSSIQVSIDWALFNPPSGGHTVRWELDYYFSGTGDTPYIASPITNSIQVDVTGGTINTQRTNTFPNISGASGKKLLMVKLRRSGITDTYTSDANLFGITFKRV